MRVVSPRPKDIPSQSLAKKLKDKINKDIDDFEETRLQLDSIVSEVEKDISQVHKIIHAEEYDSKETKDAFDSWVKQKEENSRTTAGDENLDVLSAGMVALWNQAKDKEQLYGDGWQPRTLTHPPEGAAYYTAPARSMQQVFSTELLGAPDAFFSSPSRSHSPVRRRTSVSPPAPRRRSPSLSQPRNRTPPRSRSPPPPPPPPPPTRQPALYSPTREAFEANFGPMLNEPRNRNIFDSQYYKDYNNS